MDNFSSQKTLGLLLTDGFSLMSYASVIEPYRAANILAERDLYRWEHFSVDGAPVRASNGASVLADRSVQTLPDCDMLFVFAAGDPAGFKDRRTFAWLRRIALGGATLVGVSGGPFLLAKAGLLDGYRATIHWDHMPTLMEQFPMLAIEAGLYVIDRKRVTCAGGSAGLDLAIELIEREQGRELAARISEWFIRTEQREPDKPQRLSLRERYGVSDDRLLKVLAQMEASVEEPLSRERLAGVAGVSVRQLERLFLANLHTTVTDVYLGIRLDVARQLLRRTGMSVTAIGTVCGFFNPSHFSRAYRMRYGHTPTRERPGRTEIRVKQASDENI